MMWPKIKLKKREPRLESLRDNFFNPGRFWAISLGVFALLVITGAVVGATLFLSVYFENYKNAAEISSNAMTEMNITGLTRAIESRTALTEKDLPIPPDPSQ